MIMWDKVQETVQFIKAKTILTLNIVILGSGLGSFTDDMDIALLPTEIINFRQGHRCACFGTIGDKSGRYARSFSFYEGYSMEEVTFLCVMRNI
jgi:purine nucleoside phosphorylase